MYFEGKANRFAYGLNVWVVRVKMIVKVWGLSNQKGEIVIN